MPRVSRSSLGAPPTPFPHPSHPTLPPFPQNEDLWDDFQMDGFWTSVSTWWEEKTTSPLYFTYIAFFVAWNWRFFQVIFLEDATKFTAPRIEYISTNLEINLQGSGLVHGILELLVSVGWHAIPPAIFAFTAIKYLPILHGWSHAIYLENHFLRQEAYDARKLQYEKNKTVSLTQVATQKTRQKRQKQVIEKTMSQEEKWDKELEDFVKQQHNLAAIQVANVTVYKTNGKFNIYQGTSISADLLSRLDTLDIVKINNRESTMEFTLKGKYFVKQLQAQGKL